MSARKQIMLKLCTITTYFDDLINLISLKRKWNIIMRRSKAATLAPSTEKGRKAESKKKRASITAQPVIYRQSRTPVKFVMSTTRLWRHWFVSEKPVLERWPLHLTGNLRPFHENQIL